MMLLVYIVVLLVCVYWLVVSFWVGYGCCFQFICLVYVFEVLEWYGVVKGGWLMVWCVCWCYFWGGYGFDLVLGIEFWD